MNKAFFTEDSRYLIIFFRGLCPGICVFRLASENWEFVGELESIKNQQLINPRLRHVFWCGKQIVFVYNNRVREYSLETGRLLLNQQKRYDPGTSYAGVDLLGKF